MDIQKTLAPSPKSGVNYCTIGNVASNSYCENSGICKAYLPADTNEEQEHQGCYCPLGFSGNYCETSRTGDGDIVFDETQPNDDSGKNYALRENSQTLSDGTVIKYCTLDNTVSYSAYCLNGSICKGFLPSPDSGVSSGEHPGCYCPRK